ncbi:transposase [Neorhizobium galegae]|uniref:transposase n=1 Tax=Neorhizobium galegae TaxID=399 RepID=UPI0009B9F29E
MSNSTGGKSRQTRISRMGNRELRSLLYMAVMSVLNAARRSGRGSPWQLRLLERRPFKVAAVALANKTARVVWALLTKGGCYRKAPELAQAS